MLSDRIGRVKTLQITILWFAVFTLACALAQNFSQLLWARGLMGLGFGGEWTAGAVLIGEVIRARDRGKAVGLVQAGWAIGWGISTLLFMAVFSLVPADYAWRVLFAIGIAPAPFVIWIRRFVDEPEVHRQQKAAQAATQTRTSLLDIFRGEILWTTLRASVLATGVQGGYYAVTTWLPTYLKTERHLSVIGTGSYLGVVIIGSYCGYLTGAYVSDRIGRKRAFIAFALASCAIALIYTQLPLDNLSMLVLGFPLGFCASGILGHGRVPHRTVPHADSRLRSGLLLQLRAGGRRDVSVPDRLRLADDDARPRDRRVRSGGVWCRDPRRADVA